MLYTVSFVAQYSFCSSCSSVDIETSDFALFFSRKNIPFKTFLKKKTVVKTA